MTLIRKIKDKKVNFEFNKEYIKVVTEKIANNDAAFISNSFKEMHPADAADIIEHLNENDRENLIKLNNFKLDPEVYVELNESVQSEVVKYLSNESVVYILKNLESDNAIKILENLDEKNKNHILGSLPPKDRFVLLESLSYPEDSAARIMQREFTAIPSNWSVGQTIDLVTMDPVAINTDNFVPGLGTPFAMIAEQSLSIVGSETFFDESLELGYNLLINLEENGQMFGVNAAYSLIENWSIDGSVSYFKGDDTPQNRFEQLEDFSHYQLQLAYSF